ncbi:MAG: hypothetical protein QG621_348 [Patescibacteria group bacterium]|jgi:adenylate kinase family enzyme|nr:hypothetical protein [Patescibacteria group bacterium]
MRISIIGMPGSGKTTLAKKLSEKLSIPHIHNDRFWLEAGGLAVTHRQATEDFADAVRKTFRTYVLDAHEKNSWVSDGFASLVPEIYEYADVVLYLKLPLWLRLWNHTKRIVHPKDRHPELTWWHELSFFYQIIRREFVAKPRLEKFVADNKELVVTLHSWIEARRYCAEHLSSTIEI